MNYYFKGGKFLWAMFWVAREIEVLRSLARNIDQKICQNLHENLKIKLEFR